jgi:hypothetical protein
MVEYGNPYDVMGNGLGKGHFTTYSKWRLGWVDADEIKEITTSGTYRIYAHDNAFHQGHTIALSIPSGNANYRYWLEYRTGNIGGLDTAARLGATVLLGGTADGIDSHPWFVDTTPGSKPDITPGYRFDFDRIDGVLAVGHSFQDKFGKTIIKTLAINNGTWNENGWVDIQVDFSGTVPIDRRFTLNRGPFQKGETARLNALGRNLQGFSTAPSFSIKKGTRSTR